MNKILIVITPIIAFFIIAWFIDIVIASNLSIPVETSLIFGLPVGIGTLILKLID